MATFSAEVDGYQGARIFDEHGRYVTSLPTFGQAVTVAGMLNNGGNFPGRPVLLAEYNRRKRNDRQSTVKVANGKTCNRPIRGVKQPTTESSKPRGY